MRSASSCIRSSPLRWSKQRVTVTSSKEESADYHSAPLHPCRQGKEWDEGLLRAGRQRCDGQAREPLYGRGNGARQSVARSMGSDHAAGCAIDHRQGHRIVRRLVAEQRQRPSPPTPAAARRVGVGGQKDDSLLPRGRRASCCESECGRGGPAPTQTNGQHRSGGRRCTALVPTVTGAPGDGSTSLTAAIQRELQGKGVTLADRPRRPPIGSKGP